MTNYPTSAEHAVIADTTPAMAST